MLSHNENEAYRERIGMTKQTPSKRRCLKCEKKFESTHAGNRICKSCTSNQAGKLQVIW